MGCWYRDSNMKTNSTVIPLCYKSHVAIGDWLGGGHISEEKSNHLSENYSWISRYAIYINRKDNLRVKLFFLWTPCICGSSSLYSECCFLVFLAKSTGSCSKMILLNMIVGSRLTFGYIKVCTFHILREKYSFLRKRLSLRNGNTLDIFVTF